MFYYCDIDSDWLVFCVARLRRPVGRLTVAEQKLEGEYRYVNSRLITNRLVLSVRAGVKCWGGGGGGGACMREGEREGEREKKLILFNYRCFCKHLLLNTVIIICCMLLML